MTFYNIHTHTRNEEEVSILNIFPEEYNDNVQGLVSCGFHPWHVNGEESFERLEQIVQHSNVVAIGETGFDSLKGASMEVQRECFEKHVELSEKYNKPLVIHCVRAWDWLLGSHKKYNPKQTWIVHGFRGKSELMRQLLAKNMMFSIGAQFNEETVRLIPNENLFCETDDSGTRIADVYKSLSDVRGVDNEHFSNMIESNMKRVFNV